MGEDMLKASQPAQSMLPTFRSTPEVLVICLRPQKTNALAKSITGGTNVVVDSEFSHVRTRFSIVPAWTADGGYSGNRN